MVETKGSCPSVHAAVKLANREARLIRVTIASSVQGLDTTAEGAEHRASLPEKSARETTKGPRTGPGVTTKGTPSHQCANCQREERELFNRCSSCKGHCSCGCRKEHWHVHRNLCRAKGHVARPKDVCIGGEGGWQETHLPDMRIRSIAELLEGDRALNLTEV